jgi:hypothetical protein
MNAVRTALLPAELESLRQLALGAMMQRIPVEHGDRLVHCGFARLQTGALIVTVAGHAQLAFEITRASWLVATA